VAAWFREGVAEASRGHDRVRAAIRGATHAASGRPARPSVAGRSAQREAASLSAALLAQRPSMAQPFRLRI